MKFVFNTDFALAMGEMEREIPERELIITPDTATNSQFKHFTCSFMFSTLKNLDLLNELNSKMDQVIQSNDALVKRVQKFEENLETLKNDMTTALEYKDGEIADLTASLEAGKLRMDKLEETITNLVKKQQSDVTDVNKRCTKLDKDTLTLERYTRSYNIRLFKVLESEGEKTKDVIEKVNTLISQVTGSDIKVEYGHRTGPRREDGRPRAIICRIASRLDRAAVMAKRGEFFKKGFPIYDDLPASDLAEKKKYADIMKTKFEAGQTTKFVRGEWYVNGLVYRAE